MSALTEELLSDLTNAAAAVQGTALPFTVEPAWPVGAPHDPWILTGDQSVQFLAYTGTEGDRYGVAHYLVASGNATPVLVAEVRRLRAAAAGVLAAQGTSGLDEAIAALSVALEGEHA